MARKTDAGTHQRAAPLRAGALARAVGARIKQLREERSWTQRDLGGRVGIVQSKLSKYETGTHQMSLRLLVRMAGLFGVSTDFLLTGARRDPQLGDPRLLERFRRLGAVDDEVREIVLRILDALLALDGAVRRRLRGRRPAREVPRPLPPRGRPGRDL